MTIHPIGAPSGTEELFLSITNKSFFYQGIKRLNLLSEVYNTFGLFIDKLPVISKAEPEMEGSKILIIDDDQDDVEILADVFKSTGVESVHYVHSAMEAFMYLEAQSPGTLPKLIVTDLYIPGITGAEFLADLKSMEPYRHIHVVVLSSIKSSTEIEKYKKLGASDYIEKPSSYEEYLNVARRIKAKMKQLVD
ncbi:MAG TPA: response regulator [Flavisolibacter sp.]|nr:response regulator [Flavisolibacter sp.]